MFNNGYWINYRSGMVFAIDEHERWLRCWGNVLNLSLTPQESEAIRYLEERHQPKLDRDVFLIEVLRASSLMRVRGHGVSCSFEFSAADPEAALECIWTFGLNEGGFGHRTQVDIINLTGWRALSLSWQEFGVRFTVGGATALAQSMAEIPRS